MREALRARAAAPPASAEVNAALQVCLFPEPAVKTALHLRTALHAGLVSITRVCLLCHIHLKLMHAQRPALLFLICLTSKQDGGRLDTFV